MKAMTGILGSLTITISGFGALAQADIGEELFKWLVPTRSRGQPDGPKLIGTSTEGKRTIVYISMPDEVVAYECRRLDKGGTLCIVPVPGRKDKAVLLP